MNKSVLQNTALGLAIAGAAGAAAQAAETNVQLYGIADVSIRYLSTGSTQLGIATGIRHIF
jgi:hypothetical protein